MLVEVKFSIFATQEFLFLGMIDNICESFVGVLSMLYLCTVFNFEALMWYPNLSGFTKKQKTNLNEPYEPNDSNISIKLTQIA